MALAASTAASVLLHRRIVGLLQLQLLYHFLETLTILRSVDRIRRRAYNGNAMSLQCPCQL